MRLLGFGANHDSPWQVQQLPQVCWGSSYSARSLHCLEKLVSIFSSSSILGNSRLRAYKVDPFHHVRIAVYELSGEDFHGNDKLFRCARTHTCMAATLVLGFDLQLRTDVSSALILRDVGMLHAGSHGRQPLLCLSACPSVCLSGGRLTISRVTRSLQRSLRTQNLSCHLTR